MSLMRLLDELLTPPRSVVAASTAPPDRRGVRNTQAFWQERGWRAEGSTLRGYYRTRHGSFEGWIHDAFTSSPQYFIRRPPPALLGGPHGRCFFQRGDDTFFVHWNRPPIDLDTGIRRIEHCILEVL